MEKRPEDFFHGLLGHACMAHELGFCSQNHFTRIFRAHIGITPALYRAQFGRAAH